jgi:uncharacterized membrane protein
VKTNNPTGRQFALFIGIYLIVKSIINMILGDTLGNVILAIMEAFALYTGLMYINYAVAAILVVIAVVHLPSNISNFGSNWLYLLEGIIDIACGVVLVIKADIKAHFTNKWSEISNLINK